MEIIASIIIPVYNEENRINECIESLLFQTYDLNKVEILFIDGNSTDSTLQILEKYKEKYTNIKILKNPDRITPKSLNIGIRNAKGKYIIRLDAHSYYYPDYIYNAISFMEIHPEVGNVGGIAETKSFGYTGNAIAKVLSSKFGVGNSEFRTNGEGGAVDTVPFGCFRKVLFAKIGLFNEKLLRSEDNDINSRIIKNGWVVWLNPNMKFIYYGRSTISSLLIMATHNGNALFWTLKENTDAMKLRHFIPFFFLISIVFLTIFCSYSSIRYLLTIELIVYFSLNFYFSFMITEPRYGFLTFLIYPLFHLAYGFGSLLSLFGIKLY